MEHIQNVLENSEKLRKSKGIVKGQNSKDDS